MDVHIRKQLLLLNIEMYKKEKYARGLLPLDGITSNFHDQWMIYRPTAEIKTLRGDIGDIQDIVGKCSIGLIM